MKDFFFSIRSSTLKNLISAKVSIPPQLTPVVDDKGDVLKYKWKVDLLESQNYWIGTPKIENQLKVNF